jgi:hypothetical protein
MIFADDFAGVLVTLVFIVPLGLLLVGGLLVINATVGRRRWRALLLTAIPVVIGLYLAHQALSVDNPGAAAVVGLPGILLGLVALVVCCLPRAD